MTTMQESMRETEAEDLVLTPPPEPAKHSRHVSIALSHMNKQRDKLNAKLAQLVAERDALDVAIEAIGK